MAKARAIVKRLKAVRNIRKITRTMELVATAKFKKAMDRASEAAAYTRKLAEIVADLSSAAARQGTAELTHPLLQQRSQIRKSILLVLNSNRGLCGGYNASVLRTAQATLAENRAAGISTNLETSGKRGINFFRFQKQDMTERFTHFEDQPQFDEVDLLASRYAELFVRGEIDQLQVVYTKFISAARQVAVCETLLPIASLEPGGGSTAPAVEYEYLPSPAEILEELVPASFKARLFKCFLDAAVSEQIARRVAMKSATENADEMIRSLRMTYNRARQSQITSELSEIIGGAAALE